MEDVHKLKKDVEHIQDNIKPRMVAYSYPSFMKDIQQGFKISKLFLGLHSALLGIYTILLGCYIFLECCHISFGVHRLSYDFINSFLGRYTVFLGLYTDLI